MSLLMLRNLHSCRRGWCCADPVCGGSSPFWSFCLLHDSFRRK